MVQYFFIETSVPVELVTYLLSYSLTLLLRGAGYNMKS
jgi:hypothetical protein